jgi:hypothetical protein
LSFPTTKKIDGVQPQVEVENHGCSKGASVELQECNVIGNLGSFTQLITSSTYDNDILKDHDMF